MNQRLFNRVAIAAITVALALFAGACGDKKKSDTGKTSSDVNSEGLDINGCKPAEQPAEKHVKLDKPSKKLDRSKPYLATFKTNCGDFTIKLDAKKNPKTAASFAHQVENGVYDKTWFHRIITDFVVQGGDPLGQGTGDAGYKVTEKPKGKYEIGTVAMAKGGNEPAGTSSSQFYIVIGQQGVELPPDYAIAGKVVDGMDAVQRIAGYAAPSGDQSGTPTGVAVVSQATLKTE